MKLGRDALGDETYLGSIYATHIKILLPFTYQTKFMRALLLSLLAIAIFSCNEQKKPIAITYLSKNAVFNKDSIRSFLGVVSEAQSDSSKAIFLKGIDLLKNGKEADAAISA